VLAIAVMIKFLLDVHTIAAIKVEENYSNLTKGFRDSLDTINKYLHNPVISFEGQEYSLEFFSVLIIR